MFTSMSIYEDKFEPNTNQLKKLPIKSTKITIHNFFDINSKHTLQTIETWALSSNFMSTCTSMHPFIVSLEIILHPI
jgi:hypothetical protein